MTSHFPSRSQSPIARPTGVPVSDAVYAYVEQPPHVLVELLRYTLSAYVLAPVCTTRAKSPRPSALKSPAAMNFGDSENDEVRESKLRAVVPSLPMTRILS